MASSTTFRASAIRSRAAGARMASSRPSATAARDSIVSDAPSSTTISAPLLGQCFSRNFSGADPGPPLILTHRSRLSRTRLQDRALVGRVLAQLALQQGTVYDIGRFTPGRVRRGRGGLMALSIMERLGAGAVLGAEGYVFELERRGYIKAGPFVPEVVLDFPEAVKELHREYLRPGREAMVALTYYAHREKLKDVGRENDLEKMNRQAVRLANEVACEGDALVAGNICNTWANDPDNAKETAKIVRAQY